MGMNRDHNEESMPFLSVNQQMMQACGNTWLEPDLHPCEYHSPETAISMFVNHLEIDPHEHKIFGKPSARIIKLKHNTPWGFKDPRTTFTLPAWVELFQKAKIVHVVRHPNAVIQSLMKRNTVKGEVFDERLSDAEFNLNLWEKYTRKALEINSDKVLTVHYEDLIQDPIQWGELGSWVDADLFEAAKGAIRKPSKAEYPSVDLSSVSDLLKTFGYPLEENH